MGAWSCRIGWRVAAGVVLAGVCAACAGPGSNGGGSAGAAPAAIGEAKAAADLVGEAPGLTLSVEPAVPFDPEWGGWALRGRASRDIGTVEGAGAAQVIMLGARSFELMLSADAVGPLLLGSPLDLVLRPVTGAVSHYYVRVVISARWVGFVGSTALTLQPEVKPVVQFGAAVLRGRLASEAPIAALGVSGGGMLAAVSNSGGWRFDCLPELVLGASAVPPAPVRLEGTAADGAVFEASVMAAVMVGKLALAIEPHAGGGPPCTPAVGGCLAALPDRWGDTEPCGLAADVLPCLFTEGTLLPGREPLLGPERFAEDLRAALVDYYAARGEDVLAAGGLTLEEAQAAVSAATVWEVRQPEEDPGGHDLEVTRVFAHPDVTFPGSDRVWYGAYGTATAALLEVYVFE